MSIPMLGVRMESAASFCPTGTLLSLTQDRLIPVSADVGRGLMLERWLPLTKAASVVPQAALLRYSG